MVLPNGAASVLGTNACTIQAYSLMLQPHFEGSVRSPLTLPKMGLGSPPGLPKIQNKIAGSKHLALRCFLYC